MKTLVDTPKAVTFAERMATETGRAAWFGDAEKLGVSAAPLIRSAQLAMNTAVTTVAKLVDDKTRSEPQKHDVARKVVTKAYESIDNAAKELGKVADQLNREGMNAISHFAVTSVSSSESMRSDIRDFVRTTAATEGGMQKLKDAANSDPRIAAEIMETPIVMSGLPATFVHDVTVTAVEKADPDALVKLQNAGAIQKLIPQYQQVLGELHSNMYYPAIADQAATRVEI